MIDLSFFYSAKIAVVFILVLLSLATLEAQRNEQHKFYDLMTTIGDFFGGEFNETEKALELDLNGANSFLKELHTFATREIVTKNENGEFECKKYKKPDFIKAIKTILSKKSDKNVRNFLKAFLEKSSAGNEVYIGNKLYKKMENFLKSIIVPKQSEPLKLSDNELYTIKTLLFETSFKKVEDLLKELSVKFSEEKLFNLLFSLAARLEALVHGKNIDGTLKEKEENPKDKIQTFLAVPKCFILPESELSIFDYWIEIIEMKTQKSQKPFYGVAIYKEKYGNLDKSERNKEEAFTLSQENYKILKQLNEQKFSIYESTNFLREIFNQGYRNRISQKKILQIFVDLFDQINSVFIYDWGKTNKCAYAMFFQNISESLMKIKIKKGIDPKLHLDSDDNEIREYVQKDVQKSCKKFENEEAKLIFLNKVHYELAINFEFNQRKDVYDRADDLLFYWLDNIFQYRSQGWQLTEESYLKKNAECMLRKIFYFTSEKTNQESISIIEALIGKEFNLGSLFDKMKKLVKKAIPEEEAKLTKAKKEINTKQLKNEIEFLKNNPKRIAEEKYKKTVQIICTIKQHGQKVKMLKSKIKTFEIKEKLIKLLSKIQNNEIDYFGPELLKQMKESCNQFNHIEMEEIVSEEILLKDLQFEFDEIWNRFRGVWEGIEKYYLSIPLMQLTEQALTLAKTFGKMLQNVKEHYAQ